MVALSANLSVVNFDHRGRSSRVFPVDHRTVSGANHFFWGKYERLAVELEEWLEDVL